ncbi:MAG: ADP-forming succinate--CoA ligase subunit beta [Candidatus Eisenbacteria bacterium]|nr:ADP-forming succinate--CoA ligase subunit beta [Candidatus Eisenbacteria bacterium]
MKIHEHQAMEIFASHGIPVSGFDVATTRAEARESARQRGGNVVVKAQVHVGGRGKAGGVRLAKDADEAERHAGDILGMDIKGLTVEKVVVAEAVEIEREYYVGVVIDRASKRPVFMVSAEGGVDIEEVATVTPEKIHRLPVDPEVGLTEAQAAQLAAAIEERPGVVSQLADVIMKLYEAFVGSDASLAEINPLVVTRDGLVRAIDAKMNIDDNALFRHEDIAAMRDSSGESDETIRAREMGLSYIKLDGDVGCVVNGAGLAMTTMDLIKQYGGEPANFLDIGGSSSPEKVVTALGIIASDPKVKSILVNIFGGITRCDDVANGLVRTLNGESLGVPIVVRLVGTNAEKAREILAEHNLVTAETMDEAVSKAVELAGRSR